MERFPGAGLPPSPASEQIPKQERIEQNVWRPGIFEQFQETFAAGATTKLLEKRLPGAGHTPRLRITADPHRFVTDEEELRAALERAGTGESVEDYKGRKVVAGVQLVRLLRTLDPEANPRNMVKTALRHGTNIVKVDEAYLAQPKTELAAVQADGMITNLKHIPLLVAGADCAPIIVYDPKGQAVGVFHAGYRGTVAEIGTLGIQKMAAEFGCNPQDLRIAIGPHADGERYEVDADVPASFRKKTRADGSPLYTEEELSLIFKTNPNNPHTWVYDNGIALKIQLQKAGVPQEQIEVSQHSTMRDNEIFSSERVEGSKARDISMTMAVLK